MGKRSGWADHGGAWPADPEQARGSQASRTLVLVEVSLRFLSWRTVLCCSGCAVERAGEGTESLYRSEVSSSRRMDAPGYPCPRRPATPADTVVTSSTPPFRYNRYNSAEPRPSPT